MSLEVLTIGDNQLYNPLFCSLYPTNKGFITCNNCTLSGTTNVLNNSTQGGYQDCLNSCKANSYCTSYNYNTSNGNCTQFKDFPSGLNNNVSNQTAGYNISSFTFDYNNLNSSQKNNAKIKCGEQFLNNQYINDNNIDLADCITVSDSGSNSILNADPKCVYDIYNKNNLPTNQVYKKSLISNDQYNLDSTRDSKIDNYQINYKAYIDSNVKIENINNLDSQSTSSIIDPAYKLLMNDTYDPILKTTPIIVDKINPTENFENKNNNVYNYSNYIFLILILLIIFIIFSILFYNL